MRTAEDILRIAHEMRKVGALRVQIDDLVVEFTSAPVEARPARPLSDEDEYIANALRGSM